VTISSKPSVDDLGLDVATQPWQRSGADDGAVEVAVVEAAGQRWVLLRIAGDPSGRVLVYDPYEWECFVDGVKNGEFDDTGL
jgi:uncharacterized protein DUF397